MLPLLQYVAEGQRHGREAANFLSDKFHLTEEERSRLLPTGRKQLMRSRVDWAGTYLAQAGLLRRPRRGYLDITDRGREALAQSLDRIDVIYLNRFPEFLRFRRGNSEEAPSETTEPKPSLTPAADTETISGTPEERIQSALEELNSTLRQDLLNRIIAADPTFFELLVIDLMLSMGYGGSHAEAGRHLGASGDGGVDGVINGDPLGLDVVYLQAKKYAPGNTVGRPEVQAFVGSLVGRGAQKGVFITTSNFAQTARQYAAGIPHKVILIDGDQLTSLMIRYGVGVRSFHKVELKKVDLDYFGITED